MPKLINFTYFGIFFPSVVYTFLITLQHCDAWRSNDSFLEKCFHIYFVSLTMKAISSPVFLCRWKFPIEIMHFNYIFFSCIGLVKRRTVSMEWCLTDHLFIFVAKWTSEKCYWMQRSRVIEVFCALIRHAGMNSLGWNAKMTLRFNGEIITSISVQCDKFFPTSSYRRNPLRKFELFSWVRVWRWLNST